MDNNTKALLKLIGKNIKKQRQLKGLAQDNLADLISLSRSSVSNIELGNHPPSIFVVYEICSVLNCSLLDILPSVTEHDFFANDIENKYKDIIDALPREESLKSISIINKILKGNEQ